MRVLLFTLSVIFIGREIFALSPRYSGDGVLLNKRLYYFGGRPDNGEAPETMQDLVYLDISESFSVRAAQEKWQGVQITGSVTAEPNYGFAMGVFPEEKSIMLYGGHGRNTGSLLEHTVMLYNDASSSWQTLTEPDTALRQLESGSCSRGGDGHKAYVFGGRSVVPNMTIRFTREMKIFDFTKFGWDKGTPLPPNMRIRYRTPTTLVGKDLYYIGGRTANNTEETSDNADIPVSMKEILIYHTEDNTWEMRLAGGADIPEPRMSHTITAKPGSQDIILYGGKTVLDSTTPIPEDAFYVLDTSTMTWKKQATSGPGPGALYGHSAVFVDNSPLLFVMFGVNSARAVQSGFNVLDTENWKWVDQYTSPYSLQDDSDSSDGSSSSGRPVASGNLSSGAIAGIVVGCVAGVALVAAFCFIRKRRNRNDKNIEKSPHGEADVTDNNNKALSARGIGHFKPEDASDAIPNATLSPLLPAETAPPYRSNIPNEIDPPIALSVQNITNAQVAPRPQTLRPVKPDGK